MFARWMFAVLACFVSASCASSPVNRFDVFAITSRTQASSIRMLVGKRVRVSGILRSHFSRGWAIVCGDVRIFILAKKEADFKKLSNLNALDDREVQAIGELRYVPSVHDSLTGRVRMHEYWFLDVSALEIWKD